MGSLFSTLFRTLILDDAAYEEWRERPNLFLRGIVLIVLISLVAGLVSFGINLVDRVKPVDVAEIEAVMEESFRQQSRWNPTLQDPEVEDMMYEMMDYIVPMVRDITKIEGPIPQGIGGFFQAVGGWVSRALSAIGGWLFYGALVLIVVKLLGGSAKLPDFLGMVSLYVIPGLLGLLSWIPCVGGVIAFIGTIWSIVVYWKAVTVATDLDGGRAVLAVFAPFIVILLLGFLLAILAVLWFVILIP